MPPSDLFRVFKALASPKALRVHVLRLFEPKDHAIKGSWAILSLRVLVSLV